MPKVKKLPIANLHFAIFWFDFFKSTIIIFYDCHERKVVNLYTGISIRGLNDHHVQNKNLKCDI